MSEAPFLRLTGIRKEFGSFVALDGVDLDIAKGEFVCFLGPSGCGKTTLLRIIAGLEVQSAGRIEQAGRDISTLPPAERDYGIVFQSYALFPNLSVADNVAYGLVNRKRPQGRDRGARRRTARARRPAGQRGQVPGAALGRPAAAHRARARARHLARGCCCSTSRCRRSTRSCACTCAQEIRSLQRKLGVTTIMVTHDQEEALAVADRIVVMNHGAIEQVGTPMQVYRDPASLFVADFVGRINALPATLEAGGRVRVGARSFDCPHDGAPGTRGAHLPAAGGRAGAADRARATPTCSRPRSTRSSSSAPTAWCA